ncbi:hypothetical protein [Dyadobacter bucti]|jgi:hypothetical protein|uniref:hypothetical protein n=1 Tax=Dyadobacter bucti TaxID=2572203 RepID=UPI0011086827|nr:hypothetical protein [Dyadobacter bucti]
MKFKGIVLNVSSLWVEGMAFYPFIFLKTKSPARLLINHERIHLRQQIEMGLVVFYVWYFVEYLIRLVQYKKHYLAYLHISFEREAFRNQDDFDYLKNRKFWAFLKYVQRGGKG